MNLKTKKKSSWTKIKQTKKVRALKVEEEEITNQIKGKEEVIILINKYNKSHI